MWQVFKYLLKIFFSWNRSRLTFIYVLAHVVLAKNPSFPRILPDVSSLQCLRNDRFWYGNLVQRPYCTQTGPTTRENRESGPPFLLRDPFVCAIERYEIEEIELVEFRRTNWLDNRSPVLSWFSDNTTCRCTAYSDDFIIAVGITKFFRVTRLRKGKHLFFETHSVMRIQRQCMFLPIRKCLI